ncbi:hypothetical protein F5X97DRAFT_147304 [Nemania serpens]|nr:hypothetical protein F5X97DRAFT_147304 [Nemania serpens]
MEENMSRPSGLKAPSTRIPASVSLSSSVHGHGLHEITDSQNNARAQHTAPGHTGGMKRNAPPSSENTLFIFEDNGPGSQPHFLASMPEPKRKPFATGIEFPGKPSTTSIAGVKPVKGSSLRDWSRPPSASTTNSFRHHSSNSSISNIGYNSSMGPGARPPSRSHTRTRSATRPVRPATSMGTRDDGQGSNVNDIDEKVVRMDTELAKIKSFMETTERSSASAKEELELAKKRCEHRIAADDTTFFDQAY